MHYYLFVWVCMTIHIGYSYATLILTLAKISAMYSRKLVTQPNFAVLTERTNAAGVFQLVDRHVFVKYT